MHGRGVPNASAGPLSFFHVLEMSSDLNILATFTESFLATIHTFPTQKQAASIVRADTEHSGLETQA